MQLDISRFARQGSTDVDSKSGKLSPTKPVADMVKTQKKSPSEPEPKAQENSMVSLIISTFQVMLSQYKDLFKDVIVDRPLLATAI